MPPLPRPTVVTGLVVGVVAVSTSAVLARYAMGEDPGILTATDGTAPAVAVAFWRTCLGALALAPFAVRTQRRPTTPPIGRAGHLRLAASGLLLGLHFALFLGSLTLTTVASAVTLATSSPIFVALGGWWFLREPTDRRTWVGMGVTIAGAVTIGLADATAMELGRQALLGDVMALLSAMAVTGYLLLGRLSRRAVAGVSYSAIVFGWAAAALLAVCLLTGAPLSGYGRTTWLAIGGIVVGPQLLGHTVFNTLLSTIPATLVSIAVLSEPVAAGALAWLLLEEVPAGPFYVGAPLVLVGVAVATLRRSPHEVAVPGSGAPGA